MLPLPPRLYLPMALAVLMRVVVPLMVLRVLILAPGAANGGTDTTQTLNSAANPLVVTTQPSFGITTTLGNAFELANSSTGSTLNFTDANTSLITGFVNGIYAGNTGTGATSITSTGSVTGTTYRGIYAFNLLSTTNLTISTAAVTGQTDGIFASSSGKGATSIISTGAVTGTTGSGIDARKFSGTDLTISTAAVNGERMVFMRVAMQRRYQHYQHGRSHGDFC